MGTLRGGYTVFFTKRSHDGGVDLLLLKDINGMRHRYIVQCKHTVLRRRTVGVGPVRELMGSLLDWAATACIMVTNTLLSPPALAYAKRHAQHCFCVDNPSLLNLLHEATGA